MPAITGPPANPGILDADAPAPIINKPASTIKPMKTKPTIAKNLAHFEVSNKKLLILELRLNSDDVTLLSKVSICKGFLLYKKKASPI